MIRRPRHRVDVKPPFALHFLEGVARFNAAEFWNAHESWEILWLVAETDLDQFLQGLIQLAAAYHHVQRGTFRGAVRLFDASLRRLEPFPSTFCGIDRQAAEETARQHREWTASVVARSAHSERIASEQFPRLIVLASERSKMPVNECW